MEYPYSIGMSNEDQAKADIFQGTLDLMRFHITRAGPAAKECENWTNCPDCSE